MEKLYVIVNGDGIGSAIGEAIVANDYDSLKTMSAKVKEAHDMLDKFITDNGGEVVVSAGDESIYCVTPEIKEQIESLRAKYQEISGKTLTVGIGENMNSACKALIYGKLNEGDKVVEYSPEIDEKLKNEDTNEEIEPDFTDKLAEDKPAEEKPEDKAVGDEENQTLAPDKDFGKEKEEEPKEEQPRAIEADMVPDEQPKDDKKEEIKPEINPDKIEDPKEEEIKEKELSPEEHAAHEAKETLEHEIAEHADEDAVNPKLDENKDVISEIHEDLKGHIEQKDGDKDKEEDQKEDQKEDSFEEPKEEHYNELNNITDEYIKTQPSEEKPEIKSDDKEQAQDVDGLKQDIYQSLKTFKENRDFIEQSKQTNPEFYNSIVTMIGSMIEMAKQLNMDSGEEIEEPKKEDPKEEKKPEEDKKEDKETPKADESDDEVKKN